MNNQKPEPRATSGGGTLDVHSVFPTIQGEGPFTGHRAVFVRLAGCNLQCPGCDTEYTEGRQPMWLDNLMDVVKNSIDTFGYLAPPPKLVVITGGEPLRQSIGYFVRLLLKSGLTVQIESNGMFAPDYVLVSLLELPAKADNRLHLVVSPKTAKVNQDTALYATAFKYVLDADSVCPDDGLPLVALEHARGGKPARPPVGTPVYVNPYDAKDEARNRANLLAVGKSCMRHGHIAGCQLHKLLELA